MEETHCYIECKLKMTQMVEQEVFIGNNLQPCDDLLDNFNWNLTKKEIRKHSRKEHQKSSET